MMAWVAASRQTDGSLVLTERELRLQFTNTEVHVQVRLSFCEEFLETGVNIPSE